MANDIDMWNDVTESEVHNKEMSEDMLACYEAKYINGDDETAKMLKGKFTNDWEFWGNWY